MPRLRNIFFLGLISIFSLVFLAFGIVAVLVTVLLSLLRGRKPAIFTIYRQVGEFSQHFGGGAFKSPRPKQAANDEVVDVQAHEVQSALDSPMATDKRSSE